MQECYGSEYEEQGLMSMVEIVYKWMFAFLVVSWIVGIVCGSRGSLVMRGIWRVNVVWAMRYLDIGFSEQVVQFFQVQNFLEMKLVELEIGPHLAEIGLITGRFDLYQHGYYLVDDAGTFIAFLLFFLMMGSLVQLI